MTDRELLELAARAYEIRNILDVTYSGLWFNDTNAEEDSLWNPLRVDGDALRLAVKLGIMVSVELLEIPFTLAECRLFDQDNREYWVNNTVMHGTDPYAATRRAIVIAAAEIGKHHAN